MEAVELKQNQTNLSLKQKEWIQRNFKQDKLICIMGNKAQHVCVDQKCENQNVFLCIKQCKCIQGHKKCSFKKLKPVLQSIVNQKSLNCLLKQQIEEMMDGLIDLLSQKKQSIKVRIEKGEAQRSFQKSQIIRQQNLQKLLIKKISGSSIAKVIKLKQENLNQPRFQLMKQEIRNIFEQQKNQMLNEFFRKVQRIFDHATEIGWNSQLKSQSMTINKNCVSLDHQNQENAICLLSPSITTMIGQIIKWRIRIQSFGKSKYISLGIGLRQQLRKKNFKFKPYENNDCYLIRSDNYSFAAKDFSKNYKKQFGILFTTGDIIEMQLDTNKWILKFKNERTKLSGELDIKQIPNPQKDQYHLCVELNSVGDKVEILSPIKTSLKEYYF